MNQISFTDTYTLGEIVLENEHYRHYHYPEMLVRYDSNFIEFKQGSTLQEFIKAEEYLKEFHQKRGQNHLKFLFPANYNPQVDLKAYLKEIGYGVGLLELYAIKPTDFPILPGNSDIEIQSVTRETLETLVNLKYQQDLEFGEEFAEQKKELTRRQFDNLMIQQVLAFYKGVAVGYVDLIISKETVEIDDLSVGEFYQKKGIGSRLQQFAMTSYPNKTIILLADGTDTPREMYRKQNYQYLGFKFEILKVN